MKTGRMLFALMLLPSLFLTSVQAAPVPEQEPAAAKDQANKGQKKKIVDLDWSDLMPKPDYQVLEDFQAGKLSRELALAYFDDLGTTPVKSMDNIYGRMPGYLVPLNLDKDQKATELLLVPTLGACIHVPPPPPNQTIYIKLDKGMKVTEAGYTPYWVTGTLIVEKNSSVYTDTLYSIEVESIDDYF